VDDQPIIGREREQAQLQAWAAEALAGRGSLVLLAGEAGVGKTTLARRALAGSGIYVSEGVGVQGGTSAFGPVVEVLRAHLRSEGGGPLVEGPLAAHLALLLPELGPPAAGPVPGLWYLGLRWLRRRSSSFKPRSRMILSGKRLTR
jgi:energy-coupling factor transporter ATP-binding protein EcfA2